MSSSVIQFQESIQQAVVLSLTQSKPLVILVLDDSETSNKWETQIFISSSDNIEKELSEISLNFLINQSVNLKIRKGTQDFEFFKQSFSTVDYNNLPICIINFGSSIIESLTHDLSIDDINGKLESVNDKFLQVRSSMIQSANSGVQSEQATSIQTPVDIPSQTTTPTPTSTTSMSTPAASTPAASTPAASTTNPTPSSTPTPNSEKKPKKKYSSLKEEAAEYAAQKYRENLTKQQIIAKEEKQRILRLLKADKEERIHLRNEELKKRKREAAEKKRLEEANHHEDDNEEYPKGEEEDNDGEEEQEGEQEKDQEMEDTTNTIHENINKLNIKETEFNLQIKLFDGLNIRSKFNRDDNLIKVREFICNKQKAYSEQEFFFYKPIDRITYTEQDEFKSLFELRLNRATLILKPLELNENNSNNYNYKNNRDSINSNDYQRDYGNGSAFSWIRNKVGSTISGFWGSNVTTDLKKESKSESESELRSSSSSTVSDSSKFKKDGSDGSSDSKDKDGDSPMIQSSSRYRDSENDEDEDEEVTKFRPYHDNESEYDDEVGEGEEESIYHSPEVRSFLSRTASPDIMIGNSNGKLTNSNSLGSTNIINSNNNIPKLNLNSSSSNFSLNTSSGGGTGNNGNSINPIDNTTGGTSSPLIRPSIASQSRVGGGVVSASNSTPSSPYTSSSRIRTINDQVNFSLNDSKIDNLNEEDKIKKNLNKKKKKREVYNGNNVNLEDKKDDK
ncbi:unnamed protein product [[Candida] boidinii]|uniref:Unnamed protein product n=1 Tax=Candida boidinii TaxID=5477 RepID=A0ACB5TRI5_CANBO|nr:unnamed protein product [[Candida] boidinii]